MAIHTALDVPRAAAPVEEKCVAWIVQAWATVEAILGLNLARMLHRPDYQPLAVVRQLHGVSESVALAEAMERLAALHPLAHQGVELEDLDVTTLLCHPCVHRAHGNEVARCGDGGRMAKMSVHRVKPAKLCAALLHPRHCVGIPRVHDGEPRVVIVIYILIELPVAGANHDGAPISCKGDRIAKGGPEGGRASARILKRGAKQLILHAVEFKDEHLRIKYLWSPYCNRVAGRRHGECEAKEDVLYAPSRSIT